MKVYNITWQCKNAKFITVHAQPSFYLAAHCQLLQIFAVGGPALVENQTPWETWGFQLTSQVFHLGYFQRVSPPLLILSPDPVLWSCYMILSPDPVTWSCPLILSPDPVPWSCPLILLHDPVPWYWFMIPFPDSLLWSRRLVLSPDHVPWSCSVIPSTDLVPRFCPMILFCDPSPDTVPWSCPMILYCDPVTWSYTLILALGPLILALVPVFAVHWSCTVIPSTDPIPCSSHLFLSLLVPWFCLRSPLTLSLRSLKLYLIFCYDPALRFSSWSHPPVLSDNSLPVPVLCSSPFILSWSTLIPNSLVTDLQ